MIHDVTRRVLTNSEKLRNLLWTESVITPTPLPYNSFEKSTYILMRNGWGVPVYFFTTTCRNMEDCVNIMEEKYNGLNMPTKFFKVYRIANGIKKFIYTNKPIDKP